MPSCPWKTLTAAIVVAAPPSVLAPPETMAQRPAVADAGLGAMVAAARRTFVGGEVGLGYRPGGQTRFALAVAGGTEARQAAMRVQLTAQFLVAPAARRPVLYAGLGAVVTGRRDGPGAGFIAFLLGVEQNRGVRRRSGWYAELGIGGGVRAAAGWRVRRGTGTR